MYGTALDVCKDILVTPLHKFGLIDLLKGRTPGANQSIQLQSK